MNTCPCLSLRANEKWERKLINLSMLPWNIMDVCIEQDSFAKCVDRRIRQKSKIELNLKKQKERKKKRKWSRAIDFARPSEASSSSFSSSSSYNHPLETKGAYREARDFLNAERRIVKRNERNKNERTYCKLWYPGQRRHDDHGIEVYICIIRD